jgi:flagellar assembly protein FliH
MASSDSPNKLVPPGATIKPFEMRVLGVENRPTYRAIKSSFSTDPSNPKDSRFLLSDMVHNHLSVEAEEDRRFNERVQSELLKIKEETHAIAHKEGFELGKEEGRLQAYQEEKSRLAALIEGTSHVLNTLAEAKSSLAACYESRLVALAFRMASVIVDHQIKQRPEVVAHSIRAILEKIGQDEDIRIRLAADDHAIVSQLEEELKSVTHRGRISLDLDSSIKRGDCIVEATSGEIASFIDEKLSLMKSELEKIYPDMESERKTGS